MVRTRFMRNFKPIRQKGRKIPSTTQPEVEEEVKRLVGEYHIEELGTCANDTFIGSVITVKRTEHVK